METIFFDNIQIHVTNTLFECLLKIQPNLNENTTKKNIYESLVEPPHSKLGDLAFGCFRFSKELNRAPNQIAQMLEENLIQDDIIESVKMAGPYLNLKISLQGYASELIEPILNGSYFDQPFLNRPVKSMIEYSQPNTHKELHVGHMRNICLGNALEKLQKYIGYEVITATYPGDLGTHVAKCLWYLYFYNKDSIPETNRGEWLGKIYSKATLKYSNEEGTAQEEINKSQISQIVKKLEDQTSDVYQLWKETRQWSIDLMNNVYRWANIHFDAWYWESEMDSPSVNYIKELFKQGKLVKSDGAIGMDLTEEKLGFCLLLKSDGTGLYATKDIALASQKFTDYQIENSLYVVDIRQTLHFQQVFKVLEKLGFKNAQNCHHLSYNYVELPDGPISSRKGNFAPLTQLINNMEQTIIDRYLSRYENDWTSQEIQETAQKIAQGAIKYGMLKIDPNKKIVFNRDEWLKLDGESGPFIQYSYARIQSILRKFSDSSNEIQLDSLNHEAERDLLSFLLNFNRVVLKSTMNYKPSQLCNYLYDLSKKFNHFYHECPIGKEENETIRNARLKLTKAIGEVLKKGFELMGIPMPERM